MVLLRSRKLSSNAKGAGVIVGRLLSCHYRQYPSGSRSSSVRILTKTRNPEAVIRVRGARSGVHLYAGPVVSAGALLSASVGAVVNLAAALGPLHLLLLGLHRCRHLIPSEERPIKELAHYATRAAFQRKRKKTFSAARLRLTDKPKLLRSVQCPKLRFA